MPKKKSVVKSAFRYTPDFENLKISTQVVMIYTNMLFDRQAIFNELPYHVIKDPSLTKKYKNIDKKKLEAPYGSIVSIQNGNEVRGLDMRNKKKKAVPKNPIAKKTHSKKIDYFLNEITIVLYLSDNTSVNIMIFKGKFKIAGCRSDDDAFESIMILWEYISKIKNAYTIVDKTYKDPAFLAEVVMKNVGFRLGFQIDRYSFNVLMNNPKYSNIVYLSQYEPTGHPNVNIKMFGETPKNLSYNVLIIPAKKDSYFDLVDNNMFRQNKKKEKEKYTTAIAFSSGEIILTGRYDEKMKKAYNFLIKKVYAHKEEIEIKLEQSQKYEISDLIDQIN